MTTTPIVWRVNRIAQTLSHECALDDDHAARLPGLRAWHLATVAKAAAYNDALTNGEGWRACLPGWECGGEGAEFEVRHTTGRGRLMIYARNRPASLYLTIYAGPAEALGEGRPVCQLIWSPKEGWGLHPYVGDPETLLVDRPDRLGLIEVIDMSLGREILRDLDAEFEAHRRAPVWISTDRLDAVRATLWYLRREAALHYGLADVTPPDDLSARLADITARAQATLLGIGGPRAQEEERG
jgi:hypothetical protein